jgi:predicted DNA repair protein MutK
MKFLSIAGTVAMFLVGGSILSHGLPFLHHAAEAFAAWLAGVPVAGDVLASVAPMLFDLFAGLVAGAIVVAVVSIVRGLLPSRGRSAI